MRIVFSGGGTLGPVTPLLAVAEEMRAQNVEQEFFWIGTERGVELPLVRRAGIETFVIPAGKLRRYFSLKNFSDLFKIFQGVLAARKLLKELAPDVVVSAGGFVSVPVHLAAWSLQISAVVHQQDIRIGLANRIMSWFATKITVSVEAQLKFFSKKKTIFIGNPVRRSVLAADRVAAIDLFKLNPSLATVFVFGGGTGSESVNRLAEGLAREAAGQFQILHLTGRDRNRPVLNEPTYRAFPFFIGEMAYAYAAADVVVARAGFNTITEIAAWGKPAILLPIQRSHQVENARWAAGNGAAMVGDELAMTGEQLFEMIRDLFTDAERYNEMAKRAGELFPAGAAARLAEIISSCYNNARSE